MIAGSGFHIRSIDPVRDGPALHAVFGDAESCIYLNGPAFASVEETVEALSRWTVGVEDTSWAVMIEGSSDAVGRVCLFPHGRDVWEAACMIAPPARGRGLAAKALAPAIEDVFARKGARRIIADVDPDNAASLRTFERLGFQREGYFRANWKTHIGVRDSVMLALIDSDPRPWRENSGLGGA